MEFREWDERLDVRDPAQEDKLDRWLFPMVLLLGGWGVFLGALFEGLSNVNGGIASAALSGVMSVWFCRLIDPKSSRQQLIVIVVGLAMISLTLLGCFGFLFLANSAPVQELGYLVRLSVRILGVGLCLLAFNCGSQRICARFQVPLRDKARAKD